MKIFKIMILAFVAMSSFISCDQHECVEVDYSNDLVGVWTCLEADCAEALVIKADGSVVSTGVENGTSWKSVKGNVVVTNNKITMTFEDDDNFEGRFDLIPGQSFSLVDGQTGERDTYMYCTADFSDEIVGMWVCNDGPSETDNDMIVQTYQNDGYCIKTGYSDADNNFVLNYKSGYTVVGDLLFVERSANGQTLYDASRITYNPNAISLGDIMTLKGYIYNSTKPVETAATFLRVMQTLDFAGKKYDYSSNYVSNGKGDDKQIDFIGYSFNFSKMDGATVDRMLQSFGFAVEFPDANTIKYNCKFNGQALVLEAPIAVDGNKVTVKMSERNTAFRDVDLYMLQDAAASQLHIYMHTSAFINFFGNMKNTVLAQNGKLDLTDPVAVKNEYDRVLDVVESINLSIVMKAIR